MELNEKQKQIIQAKENKILVAAAAGSGKTAVIIERVKYLLEQGVEPSSICAITFTNLAAEEMKQRIGKKGDDVFFGTIHGLANQILRRNNIDTSKLLEEENFDELFRLVHKEKIYIPHYSHLLVDEFQDISNKEYSFFTELKPDNFFYCGDSQQAIYSFRGGNYQIFEDLIKNEEVTKYYLDYNYRCSKQIISFAEAFLDRTEESLFRLHNLTNKNGSEPDIICSSRTNVDYGKTNPLEQFIQMQFSWQDNYKDWFILCRTNKQVEYFIDLLSRDGIPNRTFKKGEISLTQLKEYQEENTVKVLTIHSAKGLENKNVLVFGANLWNDEELRLCYVAATRAEERLFWIVLEKGKRKKKRTVLSLNF